MPAFYAGQTDYIQKLNDLLTGALAVTAMTFGAGSAAAPSMTFDGDSNTGFYRPGADSIGVSCGGTGVIIATGSAIDFNVTPSVRVAKPGER